MTTPVDVPVPTIISQNVLIEPDAVRILDRRVFPFEKTWVTCRNHEEVAQAIEDMVTQSSGPLFAAAGGMTLAARDADRLADRRRAAGSSWPPPAAGWSTPGGPTTRSATSSPNCWRSPRRRWPPGSRWPRRSSAPPWPPATATSPAAGSMGEHAAVLIPDGATVLTHCWAESYLTETMAAVLRSGQAGGRDLHRDPALPAGRPADRRRAWPRWACPPG